MYYLILRIIIPYHYISYSESSYLQATVPDPKSNAHEAWEILQRMIESADAKLKDITAKVSVINSYSHQFVLLSRYHQSPGLSRNVTN